LPKTPSLPGMRRRPETAPAVNDISFSVERGETIAFVGPSGAGKTTLVKLLVGLYPPASGRVLYNGLSSTDIDLDGLRERIGFVTQEGEVLDTHSNLNFGRLCRSIGD
jgi:ABC-type multidrug transport system fused ATPase/permease subunit